MPLKAIRSARSRRGDDESAAILEKALTAPPDVKVAAPPGESLSDVLWNSTQGIREKVLKTYFISGLNDGTLDPVKFGQYVVQDALYCYHSKINLDLVASRTSGLLKSFYLHEADVFERYYKYMFEEWNIADPKGIHLNSASQAYIDYETKVANDEEPIYYLVASFPGVRLWPWIGEQFKESGMSSGLYQHWVDENFPPSRNYQRWEECLNNWPNINKTVAMKIYTECMTGEYNFFNSISNE